jgi:hypothetical protein
MSSSKAGASSGVAEKCFTWVSFSFTHKHWTRLKRIARDKHASLFRKLVNYGQISFITLSPVLDPKICLECMDLNLTSHFKWQHSLMPFSDCVGHF